MILLDIGRKRSEAKYTWRAKRVVLIFLVCCTLKDFIETERSIIVISLAEEGLEKVKEGIVISSSCVLINSQADVNYPGVAS